MVDHRGDGMRGAATVAPSLQSSENTYTGQWLCASASRMDVSFGIVVGRIRVKKYQFLIYRCTVCFAVPLPNSKRETVSFSTFHLRRRAREAREEAAREKEMEAVLHTSENAASE